jgi:hypothetical protein
MYRVATKISIVQQPSSSNSSRNKNLIFNFVNEYESEDSWKDFTNKAKITLPKSLYYRNENGKLMPLDGTNINIGGFSDMPPLYLKGDKVVIESGYRYFDNSGKEILASSIIFKGFISNVSSKKPVTLECEDNMWKLKQIITPNKSYTSKDTLEDILRDMLKGTGFTVNALTKTTFGNFRTQNETVCEVLARIRKDYHFEAYFRGDELRCGSIVYIEQDAIDDGKKVFKFQQNIISDDLEYKRKDDVNLSAIAYSINKKELQTTTKDGHQKTKHERLEVLVESRNGSFISTVKPLNQKADFAPNTAGERRTLYFWDVSDSSTLINLATAELTKYYYTGMRGKFTTFGIPFVQMGDNVDLIDNVLPERNGRYKVKSVRYTGGVGGLRQVIELDYLITRLNNKGEAL